MAAPSADTAFAHVRSEEYSYRVPTPPRIVVPPPSINAAVAPRFDLSPPRNHPVLGDISYDSMRASSLLDWNYERRRHAQPILPFIYLGPLNAAKDRSFLRSQGITMMLGVRQKHPFQVRIMDAALRVADELDIRHATIDISADRELVAAFSTATQLINNHMAQFATSPADKDETTTTKTPKMPKMGRVLVFCESGNERAATVVAAYLMEVHENVDYIRAMQVCQSQRFCVNFDDTMKRLLQSHWDILTARREVGASSGHGYTAMPTLVPVRTAEKRSLSRDDDSDDDMDVDQNGGGDDVKRFGGRTFAPFVDK